YGPGACWWLFGRGMGWGMLNPYMGYGGVPSPAGYGYYPFGSGATLPYQQYPGLPNMPYGTGGLYPPPYNIPFMPSMRPYAWF
ncbi:MAG: hypothetical protein QXF26_05845, partial [Candidatus Bathyarchaeia archaeon]